MKVMQIVTEVFGKLMKTTSLFASSALLAAIVTGCTQESLDTQGPSLPDNPGDKVTLTVSAVTKNPEVSDETGTKVSYGATNATWETGDQIFLIKSDGTTITLTLTDGAGTTSGEFSSTDPVVAGTYIPYAVSKTSLDKGFVSVSAGVITLNLSTPGGGSLADALEHDILKGTSVDLTADQTTATIGDLSTHILSYLRFRFTSASKAVSTIGMDSAGGVYRTVNIATNGKVSGSDSSTEVVNVMASDDGAGTYAGYFAVLGSTSTSLMAHAEDEDGGKYTRLVSTKTANYTAGTVYGKTITLTADMVTAAATGSLSEHPWKNLGLSVKWAEFNVGSSSEYSYDRNVYNDAGSSVVPAAWSGWRLPTRDEVQELFYASERQWVTGATNGVKFICNGSYLPMGAGGRERWSDSNDWSYGIGSDVYFYINETTSGGVNGDVRIWAVISGAGQTLGFGSTNLGNSTTTMWNTTAQRLVCDYE
ncbi:MAG: hypothetical protein IJ651_00655 [Bacteroidales bacterium]|nr:hypothetical protein [Bacteroidales bacterium]